MKYQGKSIEILKKQKIFGKSIVQIRILSSGQILDVPESELELQESLPSAFEIAFRAMAARIQNEMNTKNILAPFECNVIPLPHQILALEKVMSGQYVRFLIADEVGMGKTIEAGLILKELKLRGIVKRTLIIVPKSAVLQWKQELKKHFNETFHIYDSEAINSLSRTFSKIEAEAEINIWTQNNQIIVPLDALRPLEMRQGWSKEKLEEHNRFRIQMVVEADFDLLIIDECHKVGGSHQTVSRYKMADLLCNAIPNVLLLSATPHRGKSDHFRRILQLLDADAFAGEGMPTIPELEPYVIRTEKRQAVDYSGRPLFNKRRTEKVTVTYDPIRHKKQIELYEAVSNYVITGYNLAVQTKNKQYGFVMVLFQRMMSSSTQAILDAMQRRANGLRDRKNEATRGGVLSNLEDLTFEGQLDPDFEAQIGALMEETKIKFDMELEILENLITLAQETLATEMDAKVERLLEILKQLKRQKRDPKLKFLIFTEFTSTQFMLKKVLEEKGGYTCVYINGSMEFEERVEALKNFKEKAQILISTDAAGESLNMQFAHIVINYDMPWNPMIVEQRIGRVDRIGQKYEVLALNFMLDNSIDRRVYEVVETKLNQILEELGIDKTADVLDSTIERDSLNQLYLTSLLDPARFEQQSQNWLSEIQSKLEQYKSTEGALPSVLTEQLPTDRAETIQQSVLPEWLEKMTINYLRSKNIPFQYLLNGIKFAYPTHAEPQIYSFNIKESLINPLLEPLSLQHEIIQNILSEATPYTESQVMPSVKLSGIQALPGFWSLWRLEVKNQFEAHQIIQPLYITEAGELDLNLAQIIWEKLSEEEGCFEKLTAYPNQLANQAFYLMQTVIEKVLAPQFQEKEKLLLVNADRIKTNKEKSYAFQLKQLQKVGILSIREYRRQKLEKEMESWNQNFEWSKQVIPDLKCLLALHIL
ncbi:MAG: helicase-related protein [Bacteroidia bacterium]|nr:helicase-related protein [Bacteroidia bacterium]MDW8159164.1 helicase-related protein [Bacteroidia bacterium]